MRHHCPFHPTSNFFLSKEKTQEIWDCLKTRHTASGRCCWSRWWPAGLALTFHLLLRSSGVAGCTGHADVVPVDVLEKHLRVPPRQGAGLRETEVWNTPTRKYWSSRCTGSICGSGWFQKLLLRARYIKSGSILTLGLEGRLPFIYKLFSIKAYASIHSWPLFHPLCSISCI